MHSSIQSDQIIKGGYYNNNNNEPKAQQPKGSRDIEDEEFIYKVPCEARETISLRDSQYISKQKIEEKREAKLKIKKNEIPLTELRSTWGDVSVRSSGVSNSFMTNQTQDFPMASLKKEASNLKASYK